MHTCTQINIHVHAHTTHTHLHTCRCVNVFVCTNAHKNLTHTHVHSHKLKPDPPPQSARGPLQEGSLRARALTHAGASEEDSQRWALGQALGHQHQTTSSQGNESAGDRRETRKVGRGRAGLENHAGHCGAPVQRCRVLEARGGPGRPASKLHLGG